MLSLPVIAVRPIASAKTEPLQWPSRRVQELELVVGPKSGKCQVVPKSRYRYHSRGENQRKGSHLAPLKTVRSDGV